MNLLHQLAHALGTPVHIAEAAVHQLQGGINSQPGTGARQGDPVRLQGMAPLAPMVQQAMRPQLQPGDPGLEGYLPETTYNPNPNTNIPYSTHNMNLLMQLRQIQSNPNLQGSPYTPGGRPMQGPNYYRTQNPVYMSDVGGDHPIPQGSPFGMPPMQAPINVQNASNRQNISI